MTSKVLLLLRCYVKDHIVSMAPCLLYIQCSLLFRVYILVKFMNIVTLSHSHSVGWQLFNAKWKSNAKKILSGFYVIVNHNGAYCGAGVDVSISSCTNRLNNQFELTKSVRNPCLALAFMPIVQICAIKMMFSGFFFSLSTKETTYRIIHLYVCLYIECVGKLNFK